VQRLVLLVLLAVPLAVHAELVDKIAAVVNSDLITLSDVEARAAPELARQRPDPDPTRRAAEREELLKRALDSLISDKLLEAQIKEFNIEVTDSEIDLSLDEVKKQNNLTNERFESALADEGYTMASYRAFLKKSVAKSKLVNLKVRSKLKISDEDLKAEYARYAHDEAQDAEVHCRHILVQLPAKPTPEQVEAARLKATALAAEARKPGMDFADLARKRSEGPSAADGGDLGFFRRGVMVAEFERPAFTLPVGSISDPIRTKFGWHVLKVVERRALAAPSFDEVKEELRQKMLTSQLDKYTQQYVQELRAAAAVEVKM
jgi:peptidyl-prolyl cis-trans isomerase SurA